MDIVVVLMLPIANVMNTTAVSICHHPALIPPGCCVSEAMLSYKTASMEVVHPEAGAHMLRQPGRT